MKKVLKTKNLLLALGETSNSHHVLCEKEVEYNQEQGLDLILEGTGVVAHADTKTKKYTKKDNHAPIVLGKGKYSSTVQAEFSYFDNQVRNTFD